MTSRRVIMANLMRRVSKRKTIGKKIESDYLSAVTSRTAMLEIKEDNEESSNTIVGLKRKHTEKVADLATHDLVDQTESSKSQLKKQKSRGCKNSGEGSSKQVKEDLGTENCEEEPDLISNLPDEILHRILSRLHSAKDLARLSTLSRRWLEVSSSATVLRFDQRKFTKDLLIKKAQSRADWDDIQQKSAKFRYIVTRSLQNYVQKDLHIDTIMLHMTNQDEKLNDCMDAWLRMAEQSKVRELDIHFPIMRKKYLMGRHYAYDRIYSISTLESLKLHGCRLEKPDLTEIRLPNLKKLCLNKLYIDESMIENILRCCPDIEHLGLVFCTGVKDLRISALSKLSKLELHCCQELTSVVVEAPNLQTFWLHGGKRTVSTIDLASCPFLKALSLEVSTMDDEEFQRLFSFFPFLELLELSKCHSLKSISVSSQLLKKLVLRSCKNLVKTEIDAPNLSSFEFQGNNKPPVAWNPCGLKEAKIAFKINNKLKHPDRLRHADQYWFSRFRDFLRKFGASRGLKLLIRWKHGVIMHEDLTEILLPNYYDINVEVIKSSKGCEDILDYALSTWHPKTLSLVSSADSKLPQAMLDSLSRHDHGESCCKYTPQSNKCWRHFLKDAKMGDLESPGDETSFWIDWLNSHPTKSQTTTNFSLSWMPKKAKSSENNQP